ncbi:MAG TPA: integrin alpha [Blastocatellia bacterium]|nr:integrin alpha [Blastocatellia bacterium]
MGTRGIGTHKGLLFGLTFSLLLPLIAIRATAQGGAIELAVDTANFNQDGLLVLFGGLRLQGDIGLPVGAGDINGDGRADVIFCGMYGNIGSRENNGVVNFYISDGRDSGSINAGDNPPNIFKLNGQRSGDLLGTSVSANGDVNGDGIRDVAIGACLWDTPGGGVADNRGAAYVVFGSPNFNLNADLSTNDGLPPPGITAIYGPQSSGRMGIWIDEGDLDGDGFADVVIGSDQINTDAGQHVGGAYIVFGAANLPSVIDLAAPPPGVRTARIAGQRSEEHWGAALQIGDINNDGIGDIVIGGSIFRDSASYVTPQDQNSGHGNNGAGFGGLRPGCGEAYVIYGQHNWPANIDLRTPPANATHVIGANQFDLLGSQVHSGDVNGDGRTDLIIGALQALAPDNKGKTGAVYVIYGAANLPGATIDLADPDSSGFRVTTIYGEHHLDCAGDSVRTYDINKDGLSDLFIGSPERTFDLGGEEREDAGVTEIIFGQRDPLPSVIKLYDPPASPRIFRLAGAHGELQGVEGGDEFSYRLTGGDVDGDGYIDYIANAMHGDGFNNALINAGNVYIFSGKKLSAKLGMLPPDQALTPTLTSARLFVNGTGPVQQANAGQSGLVVEIAGTNTRVDTQVLINGIVVLPHVPNPQDVNPSFAVLLDENISIKNSAGPLAVRLRNISPTLSELSNEIIAGTLVGPQITKIKVKKKASGLLVLKIHGLNFPGDASVTVTANGSAVPVQSASFDPPDYVSAKIGADAAPAPGTTMLVRVVTAQGIQSNEFAATAK